MPPRAVRVAKVSAPDTNESLPHLSSSPDYFAILQEPRRPWIDPDHLKQKFLELSTAVHPDRVHPLDSRERARAHETYVLLNAAHQCLSRHRDRLRHLLELEAGDSPGDTGNVPAPWVDFFMEVGRALRESEALTSEKAQVTSPLLQVRMFERAQQQIDALQGLRKRIRGMHEQAEAELRATDQQWAQAGGRVNREAVFRRLRTLQDLFGYLDKWDAQLQERILDLSV